MKKRILLLILALTSAPSFVKAQTTQTSDVAVWVTGSKFKEPDVIFEEDDIASFELDEQAGYGLSFNHFWTNAFSTELAYHTFGAELSLAAGNESFTIGDINASSLSGTAQWHFRRGTRFSPYVGAGIAYVQGDFDAVDELEAEANFTFDPETTGLFNAGANIAITDSLAIGLDAKWISWAPQAENDDESESLAINPLLVSAGLRYRF
jgi:outer membrane protein W